MSLDVNSENHPKETPVAPTAPVSSTPPTAATENASKEGAPKNEPSASSENSSKIPEPNVSESGSAEPRTSEVQGNSFAEVALRLGGASAEEARRTGAIDTADDQVEALFAGKYQTANSPVHQAVWNTRVDTSLFESSPAVENDAVSNVVENALFVVRNHLNANTLINDRKKISDHVLNELGQAGYWGMLVDPEFGGSGASMRQFAAMITRMATLEPTVAGLASVHGCIGAVDPVSSFGNADQKSRFLPKLASGESLSAFALTEPGAGSDLTALKTTAVLEGDDYVINGEKLFITNAIPGRTIGLVCMIDRKPAVLVVDLPAETNEHFQIRQYGIYALRRAHNNGLIFRNFRVPAENLLKPSKGDGLTIAYHGLNLGRVSLCANAAGTMRMMLTDMLPWAEYRETYGQSIEQRELVRRRIGRMAGLIVACDALTAWCSDLLDQGYRGEMECIVAKIFGSEAQKEAAIELFMKTLGGRSFLEGHMFGDNVHEFLAPCIYEGEGEMLGMALFKSLVKHHGKQFFEPIGKALHELGVSQPNPLNPRHAWALKGPLARYSVWYTKRRLTRARWTRAKSTRSGTSGLENGMLDQHVRFAQRFLSGSGMRISAAMRKYQLKLADRQCRMSAISSDVQYAIVMLVTSLYARKSNDSITRAAGDAICRELKRKIESAAPSDNDFRQVVRAGADIADRGWQELADVHEGEIMMPYK